MVLVAVSEVFHVEVIDEPGAKMSTQVPIFENDDRASEEVVEPTVKAPEARAGEKLQASCPLSLPAATAKKTPAATALFVAASSPASAGPPRDMLATAGAMWLSRTQLMPLITPASVPEPWQVRTLTPWTVAALATPQVPLAAVPATWVPWPLQSVLLPSEVKSISWMARPPKSV